MDSVGFAKTACACEFITRENIQKLISEAHSRYQVQELDLLSIDIDGNDLTVLKRLLEMTSPRVIIAEYNGKFPPPLKLSVTYNPSHQWTADDYMGASLQAFVDALTQYRLVACNLSGSNAFFVRNDLTSQFQTYSAAQLYQRPRYHLMGLRFGEKASLKMLREQLSQ